MARLRSIDSEVILPTTLVERTVGALVARGDPALLTRGSQSVSDIAVECRWQSGPEPTWRKSSIASLPFFGPG
jgi:hypothetical protein